MNFFGNIILVIAVGMLATMVTGWKKLWKTMIAGVGFFFLSRLSSLTHQEVASTLMM